MSLLSTVKRRTNMNVRGGAFYGELIVIAALSPTKSVYVPEINIAMLSNHNVFSHYII